MTKVEWSCLICKHKSPNSPLDRFPKCAAFPAGIPFSIIAGVADHRKPHKGDNGIRFEPVDDRQPKND